MYCGSTVRFSSAWVRSSSATLSVRPASKVRARCSASDNLDLCSSASCWDLASSCWERVSSCRDLASSCWDPASSCWDLSSSERSAASCRRASCRSALAFATCSACCLRASRSSWWAARQPEASSSCCLRCASSSDRSRARRSSRRFHSASTSGAMLPCAACSRSRLSRSRRSAARRSCSSLCCETSCTNLSRFWRMSSAAASSCIRAFLISASHFSSSLRALTFSWNFAAKRSPASLISLWVAFL
mmetsp:Transcript_114905/g.371361  ORF Transcript_114905/g.371361 Transcript_114905/m.371361 type:complete len:246 (-) Transcript_114905:560-1297(-)